MCFWNFQLRKPAAIPFPVPETEILLHPVPYPFYPLLTSLPAVYMDTQKAFDCLADVTRHLKRASEKRGKKVTVFRTGNSEASGN